MLATRRWGEEIRSAADPLVSDVLTEMAVAPLPHDEADGLREYSIGVMHALVRMGLTRQIADLRVRLQRMNAEEDAYEGLFEELMILDGTRRRYSHQD